MSCSQKKGNYLANTISSLPLLEVLLHDINENLEVIDRQGTLCNTSRHARISEFP
jgi:hypothetical protein